MSAAYEGPPPPWAVGRDNAKREGWEAFFSGRPRTACPFPPARRDLAVDYLKGWDAAKRHDAENPPKRGDIRVVGANRVRFIERELEGDKWEVIGPAHAPLSPNDIGRYDDILGREVRREDLPPVPAPEGGAVPEWVVNDVAELGVKIGNRFFWLYKGESLVYGTDAEDVKDGIVQHDEGGNMHWRPVFKREFGECAHPLNRADPTRIGTVSLDDSDEWKPLPAALATREEAPAEAGEPEALRMAYKTGYQEGVEDSDGNFCRDACEEGWGQYLETLRVQPQAREEVAVSDAVIRRMVEAHDTEEAAQKGEPSPWREDLGAVDDPSWVSERMTAMRCAVEAVRFAPEETPSVYLFRVDGKWELSIVDPRERLSLKPEDVVQVPISAQPTANFVAKAKHLLDLAEEAEVKALEGDEGCVWPVEALRAAYAALPFVMTITLGSGEGGEA